MPDSVPPLEKSIPASLNVSEASPLGSQCGFGRDDRGETVTAWKVTCRVKKPRTVLQEEQNLI